MTNFLINGHESDSISVQDRGFQYGDGLFETILVNGGKAMFLEKHIDRLQHGCTVLSFPSLDRNLLKREVNQLIADNQFGIIKIIMSRGVSERGFLMPSDPMITRVVSFSVLTKSPVVTEPKHINITLCETKLSHQPLLAGIKHLNQLERVMARSEWQDNTFSEGLMMNQDRQVIEGTMSNVFIVKDNVIKTPDLSYAGINGIMRDFVINTTKKHKFQIKVVTNLTLDEVLSADEIFITNSLILLQTVAQFAFLKRTVNYDANTVASAIYADIKDEVLKQSENESLCV